MNSNLLSLFIFYRSSGEKLIKYQANSSCVVMAIILMTTLFYKALRGEIWCWSPLVLKGLRARTIVLNDVHSTVYGYYIYSSKIPLYCNSHRILFQSTVCTCQGIWLKKFKGRKQLWRTSCFLLLILEQLVHKTCN